MAFTSHPGGATHEISRLRHPDAALSRALGRVAGHLHAWPTPRSQARCRTRGPRLAPATRVNRRSPATLAMSSGLSRCGCGSQAWRLARPDATRRAPRDKNSGAERAARRSSNCSSHAVHAGSSPLHGALRTPEASIGAVDDDGRPQSASRAHPAHVRRRHRPISSGGGEACPWATQASAEQRRRPRFAHAFVAQ